MKNLISDHELRAYGESLMKAIASGYPKLTCLEDHPKLKAWNLKLSVGEGLTFTRLKWTNPAHSHITKKS